MSIPCHLGRLMPRLARTTGTFGPSCSIGVGCVDVESVLVFPLSKKNLKQIRYYGKLCLTDKSSRHT